MSTTFIYTLADPDTAEIRYVGKANDLKQRLKSHCNPARKRKSHKKAWVQSLLAKGKKPVIEVLDEVPSDEWPYWEEFWIRQLTSWGVRLTNHTLGGDGATHANAGSFKKGDGKVAVVGVSLEGQLLARYGCAADTGVLMQHVLDKLGKTAKKRMWFRETTWNALTADELAKRVEAVRTENRYKSGNKFTKGQTVWNAGLTGYSTSKKCTTVSEEIRSKISKTLSGRTNTNKSKAIAQYTLKDILIAHYPSAAEAMRVTKVKGILNALNGYAETAGGYKWRKL